MTAKPQSFLLAAVLLIMVFFFDSAFAAKKNNSNGKDTAKGKNFSKADIKKNGAEKNRDIRPDAQSGNTAYYIVKSGDTLYSISKRSGTTVENLCSINNLDDKSKLFKGMKLKVPGKNASNDKARRETAKGNTSKKDTYSHDSRFLWPLSKVKSYSRDHSAGVKPIGIIIKGNPGGEVIASDDGVVKRVGYMRGYGKYIVVGHQKRYITVYSNLMDIEVKAGDKVQRGGKIGNISSDMTLHFQIDREGKPENPLKFLPERG